MEFSVDRVVRDSRPMVRVFGEFDFATAPQVSAALDTELDSGPATLCLDLTHTDFLDSAGARAIAQASAGARAGGTELFLLCPLGNTRVRRILNLLHFESVMPILDSVPPSVEP